MLSGKKLGVIPVANMEEPEETGLGIVYQRFNQRRKTIQSVLELPQSGQDCSSGVDPKSIFSPGKPLTEHAHLEQEFTIDTDQWISDHDDPKLIGAPSSVPGPSTETISRSHIMRDIRELTDAMVMNRILDATEDFERDVMRFAGLVAGKWCATSKSEVESFYQKPTEEREAERSGKIREIIEKLALKPVSETLEEAELENIDKLLQEPSVGGKSFIGAQYFGNSRHELVMKIGAPQLRDDANVMKIGAPQLRDDANVMKIGAPQLRDDANESQFARAEQQTQSITSVNSEIMKQIKNYLRVVREDIRKLESDRASKGRTDRLFSQSDPSYRADDLSYDTSYEIPKRESAKDALSREGKKLAIDKFKTTNLTPSDMYLLRTFYPSLFPENNTRVASIWLVPRALEVVLSSITERLHVALEETALYINQKTGLELEPYHLVLCKHLRCTHLFVDMCMTLIKSNFNFTRASNVTAQGAQEIEKRLCEFDNKCVFIKFDPDTLEFDYNLQGYRQSLKNSSVASSKRLHTLLGIHPLVTARKFGR